MRLLHTADWHAGRTLGRRSLDEGLQKTLQHLLDYAIREKVDAVLLGGDIFEHTRPPAQSQELVYETLLRLWHERIPVCLIAGNHDSAGQWQSLSALFQLADVHISSVLSTRALHTLKTRAGPLHLAALPWPSERLLAPLALSGNDQDQLKMSWADRVRQLVQVLCQQLPGDGPRVLLGHLMINGSLPSSSQRALTIADTYAVASEIFPPFLNYVALGHVHKPQAVAAPVKTHYAGSLRPLDFGESGQARGFCRVEVGVGKATEVEFVEIPAAQPLHEIQLAIQDLDSLPQRALLTGFYKVVVEMDTPEAGLADRVRQMLPDALIVQARLRARPDAAPRSSPESLLNPMQTFREYHQSSYGAAPDAELEQIFGELLEEVARETP
jgi:exonuclease SbcD